MLAIHKNKLLLIMNYQLKTKGIGCLQSHFISRKGNNTLCKRIISKPIIIMLFGFVTLLLPLISKAQICNGNGVSLSGTITTNTPLSNTYVQGTSNILTIGNGTSSVTVTLSKVEYNLLETKKIVVTNHAILKIINSHLYICNGSIPWLMWDGIEVQPGGSVIITDNSLIEDAKIGVNFLSNSTNLAIPYQTYPANGFALKTDECIFNRCDIGIKVKEYNYNDNYLNTIAATTDLPNFEITRTVFTSRDLTYTTLFNWATYTQLVQSSSNANANCPFSSDYINNATYKVQVLKDPTVGQYPSAGIFLDNVGNTKLDVSATTKLINKTTSYYNMFNIGGLNTSSSSKNMMNLFDNLYTGIKGQGTNLQVINSVFQNMWYDKTKFNRIVNCTPAQAYNQTGVGIWNDGGDVLNRIFISNPSSGLLNDGNVFIDCYIGIETIELLTNNIQYSSFKSAQSLIAANLPTNLSTSHVGKYGIYIETDRTFTNEISKNNFSNVETGIFYQQHVFLGGCLIGQSSSAIVPNGQIYSEQMNITNNNFTKLAVSPMPATTFQYINLAIGIENLQIGNYLSIAGSNITIQGNTIAAYNGILVNGWKASVKDIHCKLNTNFIIYQNMDATETNVMVGPLLNTPIQFGIKYNNCVPNKENFIWRNSILFNQSANNPVLMEYGIVCKGGTLNKVQCNNVIGFDYLYEFDGMQTCQFLRNGLQNARKAGFEISNGAFIGKQGGTATTPSSDNRWNLNPTGGNPNWGIAAGQVPMTNVDGTANAATTAIGQALYVTNFAAMYNPDGFGNATFYPLRYASTTGTINITNNQPNVGVCTTNPPISVMSPMPGGGNIDKDIAKGILGGDDAPLDMATNYSMKMQLYQALRSAGDTIRDSVLMGEPQLQDFYQAALSSNMEQLCLIEDKIGKGLYTDATNLINGFNSNNNIETNFIHYYQWHIAYYTDSAFSTTQVAGLRALGSNCPATEGAAVYMAQVLYHVINPNDLIQENNCGNEEVDSSNMRRMIKKVNAANATFDEQINIYPNPTKNLFNIIVANNISSCNVIVTNSLGQVFFTQTFTEVNKVLTINQNLPIGLYFVTIKNNITNEICNKKIIVQ
ncbi:MAG: Secretion system C-terminal sorting domain [Bacteroidota bacterium]|jgi:hypothetical protein